MSGPPIAAPAPPHPTSSATYCRPATEYVIGGAEIPEPTWKRQSSAPDVALYATKLPSARPWKTRFPALVMVPGFQNPSSGTSQASFRRTGSHAWSEPMTPSARDDAAPLEALAAEVPVPRRQSGDCHFARSMPLSENVYDMWIAG